MQKKIIALAVAGLVSGAAFAQSNVTIYGIVDVGAVQSKWGDAKGNQVWSGGLSTSRIGFRGVEDLGNGLKAQFTLEYGLNNDTSDGIGAARTQSLGLSGAFGTVTAGFQNSPGMNAAGKYDAFGASRFSPLRNLHDGTTTAGATGHSATGQGVFNTFSMHSGARVQNAVSYVSPNLGGVTLTGAYASGAFTSDNANTDTNDQERVYALQAEYAVGPIGLTAVYHNAANIGNPLNTAADPSSKEWLLGATYDFGMAKLFATYQRAKWDDGTTAATAKETDKLWMLGASVKVGAAGSVQVAYGSSKDGSALASDDAKAWGVQYQHMMSKRTTAYAGFTRVSNQSASALGNVIGVSQTTPATGAGDNASIYGVGLRHAF